MIHLWVAKFRMPEEYSFIIKSVTEQMCVSDE